tara:strand:+ start:3094 stop:5631 length:2538 start_codon:yes stop_codon:yes gene_type:complete
MVVVTGFIAVGAAIAGSGIGVALGLGAFTTGFGAFALGLGAQLLLGAASRALMPMPSFGQSNRGYQTTALGSALDHQIIYGKMRVGGARIYDEATGNNNKFLHRIIAVAGHEIEAFDDIYIDDEIITLDGTGNVTSPERYDGKVRILTHLGSPDQAADATLVSESSKWTSEHRLRGIAYMYIRLQFNADTFPNGIPEITSIISGKKVYDPRTTTTAWSDNPALCLRDYLVSGYGLAEEVANIDDTLVIAAANVADQTNTIAGTTRYTCNGAFTTASTPYDMISSLLTSMDGSMWYAQGKWRMKPAYWTAPVLALTEDDLRSSINVSTRHSRRDNFNVVKGTFRGSESNWQTTDYPQVTNSAFLSADGGQESVADVDLPFTDNSIEARRIALISLERNRQQLTVSASFGLRTLEAQVGDNITLTSARFGWDSKEFEVVSWNFGLVGDYDLQTNMVLRETAESVYDEVNDGIVYERDNTSLLSPFDVPSVGLSAVARTQVIREKLTNIITLTVSSGASERIDYVEAEFKLSSDTPWISLGTGQIGEFKAVDLEDGDYDFRARAINTFGIKGIFTYLNSFNASGLLEPPSDVENFVAEVNGSVITLDWDAVPDLDLSYYRIRYSPSLLNATWANSITYVDKVSRPASSVSVPARAGTYLVRAYDKSQIGSIEYTSVVVPPADIEPLANSFTLTDSTAFIGAKTNSEVVNSTLRITDYTTSPSTGEYLFSDYIETGDSTVRRCRVYVSALNSRHDATAGFFDDQSGNFDGAAGNFDDLGGNSQFADTNLTTFVSITQDDPAGTPTWSDYSPIKIADISARAFRFKVVLLSTADNITPSISELTSYVEYN